MLIKYVDIWHKTKRLTSHNQQVNWDRLTLSPGRNVIVDSGNCSSACNGCDYCWSNKYCQKFENDNLLNPLMDCHENCLGGCTGPTDSDCNVCRHYKLGKKCVASCLPDGWVLQNKAFPFFSTLTFTEILVILLTRIWNVSAETIVWYRKTFSRKIVARKIVLTTLTWMLTALIVRSVTANVLWNSVNLKILWYSFYQTFSICKDVRI